jgi:MinD superfamily P-loop ATPase
VAEQPDLARADAILDAPPGTSCPAGAAVAQADCIVLVTEPTPFGVHDFRLAVEAFTTLGKPMAVVVNRAGTGDDTLYAACRDLGLSILAEFPDDRPWRKPTPGAGFWPMSARSGARLSRSGHGRGQARRGGASCVRSSF